VEQAWWHYEDHVRHKHNLRSLGLKEFTGLIFDACPGLEPFHGSLEQIYGAFTAYKRTVPVCGAILLDPPMQKCLLVRGYKEGSSWGFPRGKLSQNESDEECAIREVIEETGYDISSKLVKKHFIQLTIGNQATKLFIIQNVDENTLFAPHVRGEIGGFGWHLIEHLPSSKAESKNLFVNDSGSRHKFFNVWPYMKKLRNWIHTHMTEIENKGSLTSFKFDKNEILRSLDASLCAT
jgi:8-oxo-dGTP pyrophosphatase MutT (NUDIX family)